MAVIMESSVCVLLIIFCLVIDLISILLLIPVT